MLCALEVHFKQEMGVVVVVSLFEYEDMKQLSKITGKHALDYQ